VTDLRLSTFDILSPTFDLRLLTMISANNLTKSFTSTPAVAGINLNVVPGEIYGLVGADGAGKTTTMRLLCGALKADSGEINVCGFDVNRQTEQAREQIGYLSQRFSMYEDLTVLENIRFFAEVRGLKANEWHPRSMEILEFVGLAAFKDRFAGQLSGGMKQKLGLASALVTRPRVLLLDEPTTGVDPVTRQDFWQLIIRLVSQSRLSNSELSNIDSRVSVLISTPYMDEAARCHRVGFMRQGRLVAEGTPGELRALLDGQILELRASPLAEIRRMAGQVAGVEDVQAFGDRLHLRITQGKAGEVIESLPKRIQAAGGTLESLHPVPATLEDVFIMLSADESA
jgi:ABC-2 type transport system ATP-binding protein